MSQAPTQQRYDRPAAASVMFWVAIVLTLLFFWVPTVGLFIGPVVGGFLGGRIAGSGPRALLAALIPAILLSLGIYELSAHAEYLEQWRLPVTVAFAVGGALWLTLFIEIAVLFLAALLGGMTSQADWK